MHIIFEYSDGSYSTHSPAPTGLQTPDGAIRKEFATRELMNIAIQAYSGPTPPDWDGFNAAMLADVNYTAVLATARAAIPSLVEAMPAAYLQVAQGNLNTFTVVLNAIYTAASVSTAQRGIWADRAESFNLPSDFVAVVRG